MVENIAECVEYGKQHGVIVAIQNHNDFIKTAADAARILRMVNSEWCGLIIDTGSFREKDPYAEIAAAALHAVNWQIKEHVYIDGAQVAVDLPRLVAIIRKSGYRGYLPIETLGPGEPREKVPRFLEELKRVLGT
jgi:sugar phosphate isomerase/epimerase